MTALQPGASPATAIAGPGLLARLGRRSQRRTRPRSAKEMGRTFTVTFVAVVVLAAFLSPLVRSFTLSLKSPEQVAQVDGPLYPASPASFTYNGRAYDVYHVP